MLMTCRASLALNFVVTAFSSLSVQSVSALPYRLGVFDYLHVLWISAIYTYASSISHEKTEAQLLYLSLYYNVTTEWI